MRIERLTPETVDRSLPFYHAFIQDISVPYPGIYETNEAHYLATWRQVLLNGIGEIILAVSEPNEAPMGAIYATVTPDLFDGRLVATEHAWYVMHGARGTGAGQVLLEVFERWAEERGATKVFMSHFIEGMPDLEGYFRARGYVPLEKHYMRLACGPTS